MYGSPAGIPVVIRFFLLLAFLRLFRKVRFNGLLIASATKLLRDMLAGRRLGRCCLGGLFIIN